MLKKQALAELCGRLHALGQLAGSEGNVSLRTPTGQIVLTPSGKHKGTLQGEDMMVVDLQGNLLDCIFSQLGTTPYRVVPNFLIF